MSTTHLLCVTLKLLFIGDGCMFSLVSLEDNIICNICVIEEMSY